MKTSYKIFIILILFPIYFSVAQTDSLYLKAEEVLENILQEPTKEVDNSNLYELLEQLIQNPVNINRSEIADLQQIPEMDFKSAKLIVDYRKKYGDFFSVEELHAVRGLNKDLIKQIVPFVTVGKPTDVVQPEIKDESTIELLLSKTKFKLRSRVSNDLQTRNGFIENKFTGTKPKIYNRLLLQYDSHFQIGFLAEKDAGESAFDEFKSLHFAVRDLGPLYRFIIGDYIAEFGQGLVLWSPYGFLKGADAIYPVKILMQA
ncbi:MAG: helix-hairpin-helix domain-containing protein [Bacteroidetes bacterium]|nr:helix-hairpin-helix domain-containing protein [Bacteroidota bacterium]